MPTELLKPSASAEDRNRLRRTGIGSSDIAGVMDLSPWDSPFNVFYRKTQNFELADNRELRLGRELEDVVAREFAYVNPVYPSSFPLDLRPMGVWSRRTYQLASPDRGIYVGDVLTCLLECKTVSSWDGWGDEGTDQIPVYYRAQVMWQMYVLGIEQCYVAALWGKQFRWYLIHFDEEDAAAEVLATDNMMRRIMNNEPPEPDWRPATTTTLKRLHPDVDEVDQTVPDDLAKAYEDAVVWASMAEREKARVTNMLRQHMGRAKRAIRIGDNGEVEHIATRQVYNARRFSLKDFTADYPDLVQKYKKESNTTDKLIPSRKLGK